ncbi:MAG: XRE family transcriptional regulator [Xanthobacteraceae bacterium]
MPSQARGERDARLGAERAQAASTAAERLKAAYDHCGGVTEVSLLTGIPVRTLQNFTAKKPTTPGIDDLAIIARACNVSLNWLAGLTNEMPLGDPETIASAQAARPGLAPEFSLIPRLDVRASAGHGTLAVQEEESEFIAFRSDWLRRHGIDPGRTEMIEAAGDSMTPTIGDGDLLLVDRTFDRVVTSGIYVLVLEGMLHVRRVQTPGNGMIKLSPDNPRYDELVVHLGRDDLRILGLVRWVFRKP